MAHESFLGFLEKASQEPALQEQLKGAIDAEAVVSVAHAAGCINVSAEQVSSFLADVASQQAANGDQDLEGVTGGLSKGAKIGIGVGGAVLGAGGIAAVSYGSYSAGHSSGYTAGDRIGYKEGFGDGRVEGWFEGFDARGQIDEAERGWRSTHESSDWD